MKNLLAVILATSVVCSAQDFDGKQVATALTRKNIPPAQRLADGHPDLGNASGSWIPPGIGDMSGHHAGFAGTAQPEKVIDVPFLPWAKAAFDKANATNTKDDPEALCLPPGI